MEHFLGRNEKEKERGGGEGKKRKQQPQLFGGENLKKNLIIQEEK